MAKRAAVACRTCGNPYCARLAGEEIVLPTDDGRCACGSDAFVEVASEETDRVSP